MPLKRCNVDRSCEKNTVVHFFRLFSTINMYSGFSTSRKWWLITTVICHCEVRNCPIVITNVTQPVVTGSLLRCQAEPTDNRRSWLQYPECYTLDRLDDCAPIAAFMTREATSVRVWKKSGSIHCRQMETSERHEEFRWDWSKRGHSVAVDWNWIIEWTSPATAETTQLVRGSNSVKKWLNRCND